MRRQSRSTSSRELWYEPPTLGSCGRYLFSNLLNTTSQSDICTSIKFQHDWFFSLAEDFLEVWSRNGEKIGVSEAAGFLFKAISGALEGPILYELVDGVWTLMGGRQPGRYREVGSRSV